MLWLAGPFLRSTQLIRPQDRELDEDVINEQLFVYHSRIASSLSYGLMTPSTLGPPIPLPFHPVFWTKRWNTAGDTMRIKGAVRTVIPVNNLASANFLLLQKAYVFPNDDVRNYHGRLDARPRVLILRSASRSG